jgi:predicted nucleic acid-binding protein
MLDSPRYFSIIPLMDRAVSISILMRHNVHDCLYVAVAEREGCDFVTADQRMLKDLRTPFPFV